MPGDSSIPYDDWQGWDPYPSNAKPSKPDDFDFGLDFDLNGDEGRIWFAILAQEVEGRVDNFTKILDEGYQLEEFYRNDVGDNYAIFSGFVLPDIIDYAMDGITVVSVGQSLLKVQQELEVA